MGINQGLCGSGSKLYAAWKGELGDDRLFYSVFEGGTWSAQKTIPGNSSTGPGLAAPSGGTIVAAWKGENTDDRLFFASYSPTSQSWSNGQQITGASSSIGPSLAAIGNTVYAGWIGANNDQSLYFAALNQSTSQWTLLPGISDASSIIGPSLAAIGNTLYAAWMNTGVGISYAAFDTTTRKWSPAVSVGNVGTSIGPSLAAVGDTLYAAWKGEYADQGIYYASFNPSVQTSWSGQTQIDNVGSSVGPALATFGSTIYAMWVGEGTDQRLYYASFDQEKSAWSSQANVPGNSGQDFVPPPIIGPGAGLGSNANYAMQNNCNALQNPGIEVVVTEDIFIGDGGGFSFQLNAYSPQNEVCDWQQYILTVLTNPAQVNWQVDNWPLSASKNMINTIGSLGSLSGNTIPAGFRFWIDLNTDASNNVVSVDFSISPTGSTLTTQTVQLTSLYLISQQTGNPTTTKVGPSDLAPIVAFELNLVGPDGSTVTLSTGAGTITYTADNAIAPLNYLPNCVEWNGTTAETSNSYYNPMAPAAGTSLSQTFGVSAGPAPQVHRADPRLRYTPKPKPAAAA